MAKVIIEVESGLVQNITTENNIETVIIDRSNDNETISYNNKGELLHEPTYLTEDDIKTEKQKLNVIPDWLSVDEFYEAREYMQKNEKLNAVKVIKKALDLKFGENKDFNSIAVAKKFVEQNF